jgi:hypothetical protein
VSALDAILAELAAIRERLQDAVDAAERVALRDRQEELRAEARREVPVTPAEMRAELDRLVAAWDRLQRRRIDVVKQAGDLAAGNFGFTSDAVRINQKMDTASGRAELEDRIRLLKARLADLEG